MSIVSWSSLEDNVSAGDVSHAHAAGHLFDLLNGATHRHLRRGVVPRSLSMHAARTLRGRGRHVDDGHCQDRLP